MASVANTILLNQTGVNSSLNTKNFNLEIGSNDFILTNKITNDASLVGSVILQHSIDRENWLDVGTGITFSGNGVLIENLTDKLLVNVRANITVTSGSGDLLIQLWYDKRGK